VRGDVGVFPYKAGILAVCPAAPAEPRVALFRHVKVSPYDSVADEYRLNPSPGHALNGGPPPSRPLRIARAMLARESAAANGSAPQPGATLQRTCLRVSDVLRDSMGEAGHDALLARALSRSEVLHPSLKSLRQPANGGIHLGGVAASIERHGIAEAHVAVESLIASLLEVLGRLIGEDMAERLIDGATGPSQNGNTPSGA
jgi:hypothetical protein